MENIIEYFHAILSDYEEYCDLNDLNLDPEQSVINYTSTDEDNYSLSYADVKDFLNKTRH